MSTQREATLPATRRIRKSIGSVNDTHKLADKENATVDLGRAGAAASKKSSRSKSLGPGGLDALKQGSGNRRASLAAPSKPPRSILKPTISALPEIPPLKNKGVLQKPDKRRSQSISRDDQTQSKIALRTEEEQQAAAREREERERRDARRKSLANRRVSFAAEATLHTFHEIEELQDSRASANSNRRASAAGKPPAVVDHGSGIGVSGQPPNVLSDNPAHQQSLHHSGFPAASFQNRDDDDESVTSIIYSSDSEPADVVEEIGTEEEEEDSNSDSDDGTMMSVVTEEITGTSMGSDMDMTEEESTLDEALRLAAQRASTQNLDEDVEEYVDDSDPEGEEVIPSFGWIKKGNQQNEAALPPPKPTRDDTMQTDNGTEMDMDMDITNAVGGIIKHIQNQSPEKDQDEDMSMEVTGVWGGILSQQRQATKQQPPLEEEKEEEEEEEPIEEQTMDLTVAIGGIRPTQVDEPVDSDDGGNEDMSMELTTVLGGVLGKQKRQSVGPNRQRSFPDNSGGSDATMDMTMDMTTSVGRILGTDKNNNTDGDTTSGMEITTAIGGIISSNNNTTNTRNLGKRIMVEEVDKPNGPEKAIEAAVSSQGSPARRTSPRKSTQAPLSENDAAGQWAFQGKSLRRSVGQALPTTREATLVSGTPSLAKTATPKSIGTPSRDSPSQGRQRLTRSVSRSASKSASPQKPPSSQKKTPARPPTKSPRRTPSSRGTSLPDQGTPNVGNLDERTPTVPTSQRRLSGLGADRSGLGSPRVSAMLDRRGSLGDAATDFIPGKRLVSFQDPRVMVDEVDRERQEEGVKENDRFMFEREAGGAHEDVDATFNLREMIDSMSPKRALLKGRKSLHVGSARGLLGKRPTELDEEEDEDSEQDGVKRLKGHQGSPVKNVRLQNSHPKPDTTGRFTRLSHTNFDQPSNTPVLSSPSKNATPSKDAANARFRDVGDQPTTRTLNFDESPTKDLAQLEDEAGDGRIHLQTFLNMTSIRFMELTTTKRRHTVAPSSFKDGTAAEDEDDASLERCVVAGACTVPTLELYQHSCRELKKYISEGRRMMKEIEADTFEENPPLFREYMIATPDVKALMDNQFKNVKTHARLLSKAMWYEWRMKLQDGLKEGLIKISEGMDGDEKLLQKQKDILDSVLPDIVSHHDALLKECANLEEAARELADSDPAQLQSARDELSGLDMGIAEKKRLIAELRQQLEESETNVQELTAKKDDCQADIQASEKIREECRGWTSSEIDAFRGKPFPCNPKVLDQAKGKRKKADNNIIDRVDAIEREYGWAVTGISGTMLSMTYKREIELVFDIASFQPGQPNSRIDLWYIADYHDETGGNIISNSNGNSSGNRSSTKTADKDLFLECIRDGVRSLVQNKTPVSDMLRMVSGGWDKARYVSAQIEAINTTFPTTVSKTSDSSVAITTSMMLPPLQTRVEVTLGLHGRSNTGAGHDAVDFGIAPQIKVVYGENFNVAKVTEFLSTQIGDTVVTGEAMEWSDIAMQLRERLLARGRKKEGLPQMVKTRA
ncbi:kinetochore protein Spc7/SPC105 [Geosmithia morbida]|uniref:Kinetochore protein Spc7/SPC105 n=1 Tax=Geosmithia morbida TaxID=1094350 RepID=A0A9P5D5Z7_9HYPO|nr:kinetochore protein Spc7/SPC105 [Geosmithia morbida]KAF4125086.1 kinetochore protein Spc7/SPC105 [Geosmithia morbida]